MGAALLIYLWATVNLEKVGIAPCKLITSKILPPEINASRDGFEKDASWNLCDHKTNVVVEKVKDTDDIIGGYPILPIFCN
ncbi:hypothetical protein Glove_50g73 [Diversispora epigaea]|uniref:Uncharacterized protein n=1 Tax=Diversispora epigaea TaxID=1348612 RepID=A0A397JNK0_9GLOM|nr:hypothetical protein Glove_50g73 [Diversispora epigaea]